jgi:SAM-dependent methyltransferase
VDPSAYYRGNATYIEREDPRLRAIVDIVRRLAPQSVLDVGCGTGFLTAQLAATGARTVGMDVLADVRPDTWTYLMGDVLRGLPVDDGAVQCVVAGEIIEHVPDPDLFVREAHRVLAPGGTLVVSTPNIVSWANRVLVPLGIQPLGTETSSEIALGRRWQVLGQGNQVQGHLKLFTHRSLSEILERYGFRVVARRGMPGEFPFPFSVLDRWISRSVPLASDLLYVARRVESAAPPRPPVPYDPRVRR